MDIKRSKRRRNRKIKFSEDEYIEKLYMRDGKAVIPVELEKPNDLYMEHDYIKRELSDSVCKYIEEIAYMIPINTDIIIEIHCPRVSKEMQEKMENSIKNNYGIEIDDVDYEMMLQNRRAFIMFVLGMLILTINILVDKYIDPVLSNFICVVWWVAIWDMIEIITIEKSDNKWQRLNYQQLYEAKTVFVFTDDEEEKSKEE